MVFSPADETVVLIGHGATASDTPGALISELKQLEAQRRARKLAAMTPREAELDQKVRQWPRTPKTDPYQAGVAALAEKLAPKLGGRKLLVAYNEFCAPSVEDAIAKAVSAGTKSIVLISTMFTPGGVHAEVEIPEIVTDARKRYPGVSVSYAWPYDMGFVAEFLAAQLQRSPQAL